MRALTGVCVVAAACGGETDLAPAVPDAAGGGYLVDTRRGAADGPNAPLVAYADGGFWAAAREIQPGLFTVPVSGPTVDIALVCAFDAVTEVHLEHFTPGVERRLDRPCAPAEADTVEVAIAVSPADAALYIGDHHLAGGGSARLVRVAPGVHDIAAVTATRIAIARAVALPPASPLSIDVVADGHDLEPLAIAAPPAHADEIVEAAAALLTEGGTFVPLVAASPVGAPAAATIAGDRHGLRFEAKGASPWPEGRAERWVTGVASSAAEADDGAALPQRMANVLASWEERFEVSWQGRATDEQTLRVELGHRGRSPRTWSATFSPSWMRVRGVTVDGAWTPPDLSAVAAWRGDWALDRAERATAWWALRMTTDEVVGGWGAAAGVQYGGAFPR